jgi:hypothetical protein
MPARSPCLRLALLVGALAVAAAGGAATASGTARDDGILNQTHAVDPTGDSGGAADLSSLVVTTYSDGTISFAVAFANRQLLHVGETVQLFVDVDDDGKDDLNLSVWPTGEPSYLDRWNGSDWTDVRQLPELVESSGSISVRLRLAELQEAAAVPVGTRLGVVVAAWTTDPATGKLRQQADDALPDDRSWVEHDLHAPASTPPPTTTTAPIPAGVHPTLTVACIRRAYRLTLTPAPGTAVVSVAFYANGKLHGRDGRAPFRATIAGRGARTPMTLRAVVTTAAGRQSVTRRARGC